MTRLAAAWATIRARAAGIAERVDARLAGALGGEEDA